MTALEMYLEDRKNRKSPAARRGRQEYFSLLRDTLHDELMRHGRSDFLEMMIGECADGRALPVLEFAALRECFAMIVDNRTMQDATQYVPHILTGEAQRLTWQELESGPSFRVDDPEMHEMLLRLRSVASQMVTLRDDTLIPQAAQAAQRDVEGLLALKKLMEEDCAALRAERDALRARVAELEEGVISQQLQMKLEVRRRQEEAQLSWEMEQRRTQAEAALREALTAAAAREQQARPGADRRAAQAAEDRAAEYQQLHTGVQAQLQAMQAQLDAQLSGWRERLCGADHRFLAQSVAALEGTMRRAMPGLLADAQLSGNGALSGAMAALDAEMGTQLRQLEQAMRQLGMTVFWPQPGEGFDSRLHSPVSAGAQDAPEAEMEITGVETPGVLILAEGAQEALVRAVVHTGRRPGNQDDGTA